jgi:ribonuclease BN (tRNA processing enzyme)
MCSSHPLANEGVADRASEPGASRRAFLGKSALAAAAAVGAVGGALGPSTRVGAMPTPVAVGSSGGTKVYLLGAQGGQNRSILLGAGVCAGTSVLVMVDGVGYLVDAGVGTLLRLNQAGFDPAVLTDIFITHNHQDHNADLGNFMGFGWTTGRFGKSHRALNVWGPTGTKDYCDGYGQSLALGIRDQEKNLGQTLPFSSYLTCHEFNMQGKIRTSPVVVMDNGTVKVSAIWVNHGFPTVGYRFETPDLDVVFSGDRGDQGDNFVELARGADVLFHEIIDIEKILPTLEAQRAPVDFISHQKNDHSAPRFVGSTATASGVPKLVLYHLIPANLGITSDLRWVSLVSPHYGGDIVVGSDLLEVV